MWNKEDRRTTVKEDKATWYRGDGSTATITVPATQGSKLARMFRETIRLNPGPIGTKVKVVEQPGQQVMAGLGKNNPFPRKTCGREGCPLALSGQDCMETCMTEGILYTASCTRCTDSQDPKVYIGESSRTIMVRYSQHHKDYIKAAKDDTSRVDRVDPEDGRSSFMWDHTKDAHSGIVGDPRMDYKFQLLSSHRDPLERLIMEATRIKQALGSGSFTDYKDKLTPISSLNRKFEYFCPKERWDSSSKNTQT